MSGLDTVNAFMKAAADRDYDAAVSHLTDDIEYQNMPLPPVNGKDAVKATLDMLLANAEGSEWVVHRETETGNVVMNERTDRFELKGKWIEAKVAGLFVVRDGKIALWRDYFDLAQFQNAMGG